MNAIKKRTPAGTAVALFCVLFGFFGCQRKGESASDPQTNQEFGSLYVRPGWLCEGVTNIIHRPAKLPSRGWSAFTRGVAGVHRYLPDACHVTVQPAIATNPLLADVYHTISNAISAVDTILKDKNFYVMASIAGGGLISVDAPRKGIWNITPSKVKGGVGHIQFDKYEDDTFTLLNQTESFYLSFNRDDKSLKHFGTTSCLTSLHCEHMTWDVHPFDIEWNRRISPNVTKEQRFDAEGRLVSEKLVDDRNFP
jgi:hypothetical protein